MPIRAIAFDVHGTLVHWPHGRVKPIDVQRVLAKVGIEISYQAYEAARQAVLFIEGAKRRIENWTDFLALLFDRMGVRVPLDVLPSVAHLYEKQDAMACYSDALPAVNAAREAGLVTCAFTSLPPFMLGPVADEVMERLDQYFDCGVIGFAKGDRRFYLEIADRLKAPAGEILAVGDDRLGDCELPMECSWQAVWLDRTGEGKAGADKLRRIKTLYDLPSLIASLR